MLPSNLSRLMIFSHERTLTRAPDQGKLRVLRDLLCLHFALPVSHSIVALWRENISQGVEWLKIRVRAKLFKNKS